MPDAIAPRPLPNEWWKHEETLLVNFIPDTIALRDEPDATPARVSDVVIAEMAEMQERRSTPVAVPPLGSPHFAEAFALAVTRCNQFRGPAAQIEVLDAAQGRVRTGTRVGTLRLLVMVFDEQPFVLRRRTRPSEPPPSGVREVAR